MISQFLLPAMAMAFLIGVGVTAVAAQSDDESVGGGCADFGGSWQPGTIVIEEQPVSADPNELFENVPRKPDCNLV